jgi:acyl-coenzyme A thioesterase PaaI-like protein
VTDLPLPEDARTLWLSEPPPDHGPRAQKHELVRLTKLIIEDVALLDVAEVDDEELAGLIRDAQALAHRLDARPSLRAKGGPTAAGGDDAVLVERSGITGRSNPLAPPVELWFEGEITRGAAVWTDAYEGPPGCVHGGFIAAAFDDVLGCAQMTSGLAGFTGTLTVKMLKPTPLNRRIQYEAGVDRVEGRKIWCWGRAWFGRELLAEATCVFIQPSAGMLEHLGDLVPDELHGDVAAEWTRQGEQS